MLAEEHVGMWSTADGQVRKLLLPNGRYLALIAGGEIRHQGEYRVVGSRISISTTRARRVPACSRTA